MTVLTPNQSVSLDNALNKGGYVFDFNDNTFISYFTRLEVSSIVTFKKQGLSKGKSLKRYWDTAINKDEVVKVLNSLCGHPSANEEQKTVIMKVLNELNGIQKENITTLKNKQTFKEIDWNKVNIDIGYLGFLEDRYSEVKQLYNNNIYLSAIVMIGSLLEAILANKLKDVNSNLATLINKCDGDILNTGEKIFCDGLRIARNNIHYGKQMSEKYSPNEEEMNIAYNILVMVFKKLYPNALIK